MVNEDLEYLTALGTKFTAIPIERLLSGDKRSAGTLFQGVANGDTKQLVIENNTADEYLLVLEPTVKSSGQFYTKKIKNPTVDTQGDAVPVINPLTDNPDTVAVDVFTAGDGETGAISGGTDYPETTAGSGSNKSNADPGESGTTGVSDAIAPGDTLAVQASNESGSTQDMSIIASFITLPEGELEALAF